MLVEHKYIFQFLLCHCVYVTSGIAYICNFIGLLQNFLQYCIGYFIPRSVVEERENYLQASLTIFIFLRL